jgi:hypothetical protein
MQSPNCYAKRAGVAALQITRFNSQLASTMPAKRFFSEVLGKFNKELRSYRQMEGLVCVTPFSTPILVKKRFPSHLMLWKHIPSCYHEF